MTDIPEESQRTLVSRNGKGLIFTDNKGTDWIPRQEFDKMLKSMMALRPTREVKVPLPGGTDWIEFTLPKMLTETEWEYLFSVLAVMKLGLVGPDPEPDVDPLAEPERSSSAKGDESNG